MQQKQTDDSLSAMLAEVVEIRLKAQRQAMMLGHVVGMGLVVGLAILLASIAQILK